MQKYVIKTQFSILIHFFVHENFKTVHAAPPPLTLGGNKNLHKNTSHEINSYV